MLIGIGTDIIEIARIKKAVLAREEKFTDRIYTQGEINYCQQKKNPYPSYAARFAAKEAVLKALGLNNSGIQYREIEVVREEGPPQVVLHGQALAQAHRRGINRVLLSLSHNNSQAVAYAVAMR